MISIGNRFVADLSLKMKSLISYHCILRGIWAQKYTYRRGECKDNISTSQERPIIASKIPGARQEMRTGSLSQTTEEDNSARTRILHL